MLIAIPSLLISPASAQASTPFNGSPFAPPAAIEFEQYDSATLLTADPNLKKYRADSAGIARCTSPELGYTVTAQSPNQVLRYTVYVPTPGSYKIDVRMKGTGGTISFQFVNQSNNHTYTLQTTPLSTSTWATLSAVTINLAGEPPNSTYTLNVVFLNPNSNAEFNYFSMYNNLPPFGVPSLTTNVTLMAYDPADDTSLRDSKANSNRQKLQSAVDFISTMGGGTVNIPNGTFMLRQANPREYDQSLPKPHDDCADNRWFTPEDNYAVHVNAGNIKIAGGGPSALVTEVSSFGFPRNDASAWVGFQFTVGASPMTVTELGRWVVGGNSHSHTVQLFNADGSAVSGGSVTVNTAGQAPDQFAYATLGNPVTLAANTTYALMSYEVADYEVPGSDVWLDYSGTSVTASQAASAVAAVYSYDPPEIIGATAGENRSYGPVNLRYRAGLTTLLAHNRDTTLLLFGDVNAAAVNNVVLTGMTLQGNPTLDLNGDYDPVGLAFRMIKGAPTEFGGCDYSINAYPCFGQSAWPTIKHSNNTTDPLGDLVVFSPNVGINVIKNIEISNCVFVNPSVRAIWMDGVANANIHDNSFFFFVGMPPSLANSLMAGLGIAGGWRTPNGVQTGTTNLNVMNNYFNGNAAWTDPDPNQQYYAADGLLFFIRNGNFYIANNFIENYGLEGVQVNSGPAAIVQNTFTTRSRQNGAVALDAYHGDRYNGTNLTSVDSIYAAYCFVGNTVNGGGVGCHGAPFSANFAAPYDLFVSGNGITNSFSPIIDFCTLNPWWGAVGVTAVNARFASISGNVISAIRGIDLSSAPNLPTGDYRIFCNDLSRVRDQAIFDQDGGSFLKHLKVYANLLGRSYDPNTSEDVWYKHLYFEFGTSYLTRPTISVFGNNYYHYNVGESSPTLLDGYTDGFIWSYSPSQVFDFLDKNGSPLPNAPINSPLGTRNPVFHNWNDDLLYDASTFSLY